jgi:hypothetical protein
MEALRDTDFVGEEDFVVEAEGAVDAVIEAVGGIEAVADLVSVRVPEAVRVCVTGVGVALAETLAVTEAVPEGGGARETPG